MKLVKRVRWEERIYRVTEIIAISKKDNDEEVIVSTEESRELIDSGHIEDKIVPKSEQLYPCVVRKI